MAIPKQLKHATIAIMDKINTPPIDGNFTQSKFVNAWNIAFHKIQQNGYAYVDNSAEGTLEDRIKLTSRGFKKEVEHLKDTTQRVARFDDLFKTYQGLLK